MKRQTRLAVDLRIPAVSGLDRQNAGSGDTGRRGLEGVIVGMAEQFGWRLPTT
jgi:hypothetical protein